MKISLLSAAAFPAGEALACGYCVEDKFAATCSMGAMIRRLLPALCAALVLASCAVGSNWYLMDSGYSINPVDGDAQAYAIEVHLNQLKQLGGEVNSAEFRLFVAERLKMHGICPRGWQPLQCVQDGSCVQHTHRSVTVTGRCVAS